MKKQIVTIFATGLFLCGLYSLANAALVTIGKATYSGEYPCWGWANIPIYGTEHDYKLVYDTDLEITWLDYSKCEADWNSQMSWAQGLGGELSVTISPISMHQASTGPRDGDYL